VKGIFERGSFDFKKLGLSVNPIAGMNERQVAG
jgi:hypothetical protein